MSNKGFSIVELMTVFVVIILITTIAVTAFNVVSYQNKEQLNENLTKTIEDAAESYCSSQTTASKVVCVNAGAIPLSTLVTEGILEGELTNYVEELPLCTDSEVTVTGSGYNYTYTYDIDDTNNFSESC